MPIYIGTSTTDLKAIALGTKQMSRVYVGSRLVWQKHKALELTFDNISNVPVTNANSVSDWNAFFDLPTNGTPFSLVQIVGNTVKLLGGSGIRLKYYLFRMPQPNPLISINDNANCILSLDSGVFSEAQFCNVFNLNAVTSVGYFAFEYIRSCEISLKSVVSFSGLTFYQVAGNTIKLIIPAHFMTDNNGNPISDIQYLIDNNTVTIYDPAGNQIYP